MAIACDSVWDAYIKVHPDAHRSTKKKQWRTIMGILSGKFHSHLEKCCSYPRQIFGWSFTTSYFFLFHFWLCCPNIFCMDCYLIDILLDEIQKGNNIDFVLNNPACCMVGYANIVQGKIWYTI